MKVNKKGIFLLSIVLLMGECFAGNVKSKKRVRFADEEEERVAEGKLKEEEQRGKLKEEEQKIAKKMKSWFEPQVEESAYIMPNAEERFGARFGQSQAEIVNEVMFVNEKVFAPYWVNGNFEDIGPWIGALQDLETYVAENAPRNEALKIAAAKIREIGLGLPQKIQFMENLSQVKKSLQNIENKIKTEYLWGWGAEKREEVRNVLEGVIRMLMINIDNALKMFQS
ncbi:MAG: hypothetical protein WCD44_02655 [Candidatus Babeliales bacterium]